MTSTFNTPYGIVDIPSNEEYIIAPFRKGTYWDIDTMLKMRPYINPTRNVIEIGAHVGTSTLVYRSFLNTNSMLWAFEPQQQMYSILSKNIAQNKLSANTIPVHGSVFCYTGTMNMNDRPLDGQNTHVQLSTINSAKLTVNYGGISIGAYGERIRCYRLDEFVPELTDIGFIHCDAQGSDSFALWGAREIIRKYRPAILFEDKTLGAGPVFYKHVCEHYPQYTEQSKFDVISFCMNELKYSQVLLNFNNSENNLLIP